MKRTKIIPTTAFFLALGIAGPVAARQEKPEKQEEKAKPQQQEKAKPQQQENGQARKEQQARPEPQQEKPAKQSPPQAKSQQTREQKASQDSSAKQQSKTAKQEQRGKPEKQQQALTQQQPEDRQQHSGSARPPERTPEAKARQQAHRQVRLSERGSGRIPDERFHSNFGREHNFRMREPVLVGGYSRFQYGGYWFGFVEPWPSDWYYTDDVYIDYVDGGYYMYNPYYPGTRFAISVVI
jgi:hypothetical protein